MAKLAGSVALEQSAVPTSVSGAYAKTNIMDLCLNSSEAQL